MKKFDIKAGDIFDAKMLFRQLRWELQRSDGQNSSVIECSRDGGQFQCTRFVDAAVMDSWFAPPRQQYVVTRMGREAGPRDCGETPYLVEVVQATPYVNGTPDTSIKIKLPTWSLKSWRLLGHDAEVASYAAGVELLAQQAAVELKDTARILNDVLAVANELSLVHKVIERAAEMEARLARSKQGFPAATRA